MSSPQQRLSSIANQVSGSGGAAARQQLLSKNPDDVVCIPSEIVQRGKEMKNVAKKEPEQVVTYAARTPLTKARKGGLKDTTLDNLLVSLLTVCIDDLTITKIQPVSDIHAMIRTSVKTPTSTPI